VNLVLPLIGMFIIWSRPVGTMSHSTGSAWIQYSRAGPLTVNAASSVVPAPSAPSGWPPTAEALAAAPPAPAASAAATFGGTASPLAWASTSICPSVVLIFCPASVQKNMPPPRARNPRRSMSMLTSVLLFDDDRHFHLRRVDRADEVVGPRRRERLFEFGVGDRGRLGRVGLLFFQPLRPALQVDVVRIGVAFRPDPVHRLALLQGQLFGAEVEVGDRDFLRLAFLLRRVRRGRHRPREGEGGDRDQDQFQRTAGVPRARAPQHVSSPGFGWTSTGL